MPSVFLLQIARSKQGPKIQANGMEYFHENGNIKYIYLSSSQSPAQPRRREEAAGAARIRTESTPSETMCLVGMLGPTRLGPTRFFDVWMRVEEGWSQPQENIP
jgi:hypothetical protein